MGRVVLVGLSNKILPVDTYREILGNEVELIGSNDHRLQELPKLIEFVNRKQLDISEEVTQTILLEVKAINETLRNLSQFKSGVCTVIVP